MTKIFFANLAELRKSRKNHDKNDLPDFGGGGGVQTPSGIFFFFFLMSPSLIVFPLSEKCVHFICKTLLVYIF